jgi:pyruvate/2-oxoglutarate dehydrogenase complex dihydrolipoamide dehydrogenase (E3) component
VNGVFPFTHVAGYEAGIALSNAVLRLPRRADYTKVPWCTYTDPEIASVGLNEKRAKAAGVPYRVLESGFREVDRALAEGEAEGKIKVLVSPSGQLLGCQIAGHHAGELIHEWVAAVNGGVKLSTLAGAIHAYPTLSEISKRAAGSYYSEKLFSDRTRKILRFLFDLKGRACHPGETAG